MIQTPPTSTLFPYTTLFRSKRFEPDADTLALYHCDEGEGDVLKDSSGNGHHGKIVGAKWVVQWPDKTVPSSVAPVLPIPTVAPQDPLSNPPNLPKIEGGKNPPRF